jgi:hypothetical protein
MMSKLASDADAAANAAGDDTSRGLEHPHPTSDDMLQVAQLIAELRTKCPPTKKGETLPPAARKDQLRFMFLKFHKEVWTMMPSYINRENYKKSKSHVGVPVWMNVYCILDERSFLQVYTRWEGFSFQVPEVSD